MHVIEANKEAAALNSFLDHQQKQSINRMWSDLHSVSQGQVIKEMYLCIIVPQNTWGLMNLLTVMGLYLAHISRSSWKVQAIRQYCFLKGFQGHNNSLQVQ